MYINNIKNQFNGKIWVVCNRVNFNIYRGLKYDWKIKVVWQQMIFIIWIIFAGCLIGHNKILLKKVHFSRLVKSFTLISIIQHGLKDFLQQCHEGTKHYQEQK